MTLLAYLKQRLVTPDQTCRKQVIDDVYLQRHLFLIQWTNQMGLNVRPLLLH